MAHHRGTRAIWGWLSIVLFIPSPAVAGLVGWWPFDGNLDDRSGSGLTAAAIGAPAFDADKPAAVAGQSLRLPAGDLDGVQVTAAPELNVPVFTLGYFINQDGAIQGGAGLERLTSRAGDGFETAVGSAAALGGTISPTGTTLSYYQGGWNVTQAAVPDEGWIHVAWRNRGSGPTDMELYVDGELVFTGPGVGAARLAGILNFGIRHNNVEGFEGLIDDAFLWDDAADPLTPADIAAIAGGGIASFLGLDVDSDGDGLPDPWEIEHGLDPDDNGAGNPDNGAQGDPDNDGATNAQEFEARTDPRDEDSDDDELTDGQERTLGTHPLRADTDGDGLDDGREVALSTDPLDPDSDDDGFLDGFEVEDGSDPNDPDSVPGLDGALVLHLTFDGTADDESVNANHGTITGSAGFSADVPDALGGGQSLELTGNTANDAGSPEPDGVNVPGHPGLGSNPFTLAYWIKATAEPGGNGLERITSRPGDAFETAIGNASALGGTTSPTGITLSYYQGGWVVTNAEIELDRWIHVAWVNTAADLLLYVDGELVFSGPRVGEGRLGEGFMNVGTRHNMVEGFEGNIDDLRLYSVPLDAEAVAGLAAGGGGGFVFRITDVLRAGDGSVSIEWTSRPGRLYSLFFSPDFETWLEVDDGIPSGGETTTYTDETLAPLYESGFYQVRQN